MLPCCITPVVPIPPLPSRWLCYTPLLTPTRVVWRHASDGWEKADTRQLPPSESAQLKPLNLLKALYERVRGFAWDTRMEPVHGTVTAEGM